MVLPLDIESYSYRFFKNLNEDVKLKSDEYGRWDVDFDFEKDDWVNVDGFYSVINACIIAIMTRYTELEFMELYEDFGCRVHELIKANKSKNVAYKIELFITDVLNNIRRVKKINWITVTDCNNAYDKYQYRVGFSVSCTLDEEYDDDDVDTTIIEEEFLI